MIIEVKVFSFLRQDAPVSGRCRDGDPWEIPEGANVAHALGLLNIPKDQNKILLVNGRGTDRET